MKRKNTELPNSKIASKKIAQLNYPPSEDVFNQNLVAGDIDPETISKQKALIEKRNSGWNEMNFNEDVSGLDLDISGAELDDDMEKIGSEDEENNGYSIGGDNHNDLEEDHS